MSNPHQTFKSFVAQLNRVGLNLCASFNLGNLPQTVKKTLPGNAQQHFRSLLLVGTNGGNFWQHLQTMDEKQDHPFDMISQRLTEEILTHSYPQIKTLCLYPSSEYVLPLQQLGHLVGWGRPSILGLDINQEYGTWFAYRTALLVSELLPQTKTSEAQPVCEVCIDKPCRSICPVNAVQSLGNFDILACSDYRVEENSTCAKKCLARLACPVGQDYRYSTDQLEHHGSFSLASVKRYKESNKW